MDREVKFRVWNNRVNKYMTPNGGDYSFGVLSGKVRGIYGEEFPEMEVEQFTGLHDKNGKEIYEGDILEDVRLDGSKRFYKVFYKKGGLVINIHQDDFKKDNPLFYEPIADMQTPGFIEQNCTIIGNINENPELFSGGKK